MNHYCPHKIPAIGFPGRLSSTFRNIALTFFLVFFIFRIDGQDITFESVPITKMFYKMSNNVLGSFKYNYGINYIAACAVTYVMIESDIDWNWYRYSGNRRWIYHTGYFSVYTGSIAPTAVSLGLYLYGLADKNPGIQITGLALGQSALVGLGITTAMKILTGRVPPSKLKFTDDLRGDFHFGFLRGGIFNGWPSSHTCVAFAMATTLAELYPDNSALKIGSFAFATLIGLGVSTNVHWVSDVLAGGLIGYAIGKNVGTSFRDPVNSSKAKKDYNLDVSPTGISFNYRF